MFEGGSSKNLNVPNRNVKKQVSFKKIGLPQHRTTTNKIQYPNNNIF